MHKLSCHSLSWIPIFICFLWKGLRADNERMPEVQEHQNQINDQVLQSFNLL